MTDENRLAVITRTAGINAIERRYPLEDVEAFFSDQKYTLVRVKGGKDTFLRALVVANEGVDIRHPKNSLTLKKVAEWLEQYQAKGWIRIHRNAIVNMRYVKTYKDPESIGCGPRLGTESNREFRCARRETSSIKYAWRTGVGVALSLLVAFGLALNPPAAQADPAAVIAESVCENGGCWLFYEDGASRYVIDLPNGEQKTVLLFVAPHRVDTACSDLAWQADANKPDHITCDCNPTGSVCLAFDAQSRVMGTYYGNRPTAQGEAQGSAI